METERPLPPPELFQPILEPPRPALGATQKTAALIIEEFREKLAVCNAEKWVIADYLLGIRK